MRVGMTQQHKRGPKGTVGTCYRLVFEEDETPRFLENLFLNAEIREGNGLEYMVEMWEGRGDVEVPLSRQGRKDDVQVHFLGCKA